MALVLIMTGLHAQVLAEDDDLPGSALLEFLAEWETADGQWVDPVDLAGADAAETAHDEQEVPHE